MRLLQISANHRHLATSDGAPFFWLGDTAWTLFHRLSLAEASFYLRRRASQGFNIIQAVALDELGGPSEPNANGDCCVWDGDPRRPNEGYFAHIDAVMAVAEDLGLRIALLPAWGRHVGDTVWPKDRGLFDPGSAYAYGRFLGLRHAARSGLIWVLGGDRPCAQASTLELWRAMAAGIRDGGARQLMTWHPPGGRSSGDYVHAETWLDFNMIQSSHFRRACENWRMVARDWARAPVRPTFDGEPCYEEMPLGFYVANGIHFDAHEVRQAAYWSVLAGGCGFTYGCQAVWQMWIPGRAEACGRVLRSWRESLDLPGAGQMRHLRALIESRPVFARRPADELLIEEWPCSLGASNHVGLAACDGDAGQGIVSILAYTPVHPVNVQIDTSGINDRRLRLWAFDPRNGRAHDLGARSNAGRVKLPGMAEGPDWVYVIDAASADRPPPGDGSGPGASARVADIDRPP